MKIKIKRLKCHTCGKLMLPEEQPYAMCDDCWQKCKALTIGAAPKVVEQVKKAWKSES